MSVFLFQLSGMQIAHFLHRIILSLACLDLPYFSTYLTIGTMSGEKGIVRKVWFDFPYDYVWKCSHSNRNGKTYHKCAWVFCKVPV